MLDVYVYHKLTQIKNHYLVRVHDGIQTVSNSQHGAVLKFFFDDQLNKSVSSEYNNNTI